MSGSFTVGDVLKRMEQKKQIVSDMVVERLNLLKQFGVDGNDHNDLAFYNQLIAEHTGPTSRKYYLKLAALCFAAIEALEKEPANDADN